MHNAVLLTGILVSHDFVVFREVWVRTSANPLCFGGKKVCMGKQQQTITHTHTLSLFFSLSLSFSPTHTHTPLTHTQTHRHRHTHTLNGTFEKFIIVELCKADDARETTVSRVPR